MVGLKIWLVIGFGILAGLSLVSFLFLRWLHGKTEVERARNLLRVMQIRCVWDNPPASGFLHIFHGLYCEAAQTICGVVIDPYKIGTVDEGYAEGQGLCPQCVRLADSYVDIAETAMVREIETNED